MCTIFLVYINYENGCICLENCIDSVKKKDLKKFSRTPRAELEKLCTDEETRFDCELMWEYDGGYISS